jgi:D-alanyl-D-alanine carboxypeptidase
MPPAAPIATASAETAPPPTPAPAIAIARVRTVRIQPPAAAPEPIELRGTTGHDATARVEPAQRAPSHPPADQRPLASPPAWVGASAPSPPASASQGRPALFSGTGLVRGAAPSTLDEQAAKLARGGPPVAVASADVGAFHIQIGSYQSQAEAERRLASARELAPGVLASHSPVTTQFKQGAKLYFRARYAGFEAKAAASACSELKRLKIDCLVMKAE